MRDALHVLTGEGLVETRTSDGFHIPQIDEPALKDLYAWNKEVIVLAIRGWPKIRLDVGSVASRREVVPLADAVQDLFTVIADQSTNPEHARTVASLNARLHAPRTVESYMIDDITGELSTIRDALDADDRHALRQLTTRYHRRRQRAAAEIVRALYRIG